MNSTKVTFFKRFTLINVLVFLTIVTMVSSAIYVAADPVGRQNAARNDIRWNDSTNIVDSILKYQADNEGVHYDSILALTDGEYYQIGTDTSGCDNACSAQPSAASACVDLSLMVPDYFSEVPKDPKYGKDAQTNYYLLKDSNGSITVGACSPEGEGDGGTGLAPIITLTK